MKVSKLELAAENNDFVGLQAAIHSCEDINEQNIDGNTALHVAISRSCHFDILKLLLSNGASAVIKNKERYNPLQLIDPESHVTFLNLFRLEQYIDYSVGVKNTIMHLLMTTDTADISLWNMILEEYPTLHIDFNAQNVIGHTPLHVAATRIMGIEDLQFILDNFDGLDIFIADEKGNTFLHTFIANMENEEYHISFLTRLLEGEFKYCTKTDINKLLSHKNKTGHTPLHLYINKSYEVTVDALKEFTNAGAKIDSNNVYGENILHALIKKFEDAADLIEYALENGGKVNVQNGFGESPIFLTADIDVVQILLKANADLNIRNKVGKTPLMSMILRYEVSFELIEILIKNGANVNAVDNFGNSVLHFAAWNGVDEDIMNLLQVNGIKSIRDSMGYLPCQIAHKMEHIPLVQNICTCENSSDAHLHEEEVLPSSKEIVYLKELLQSKDEGNRDAGLNAHARFLNEKSLLGILKMPGIGSVELTDEAKMVKESVVHVIQNICEEIGKHDHLLVNTFIQSGSVGENTKVGLPDEFDFVCLLDIFSNICEVDEELTKHDPGYVYIKLRQEYLDVDQYRHLFNNFCYMDTEGLRERFVDALTEVIQNLAVCKNTHIVMELGCFKESQMAPNCQLTLRWTSCEYKDIEINVDLVPACRINGWWPTHTRLDVLASKTEENRKEGAILLLQTTFDEDFEQVTKLRVSALSAEKTYMKSLPQTARDAYMVSKILIDSRVCPRVSISPERGENLLRTYTTSYMLKNCLFHIAEKENWLFHIAEKDITVQAISYNTNFGAGPSQSLHEYVCKLFRQFQNCIENEKLPSFMFPWQDIFTFQDKEHVIFPGQNHINCTCRAVYTKLILKLLGQKEIFKDMDIEVLLSS